MNLAAAESGGAWQVGRCRVELASREISGPDSPRLRRVTPKSLAVLRLLCAAAGQVVSREALLAGVWPDSAPTDDVLTQAVTQLRKAFAAADGSGPYIETIARGGYRLLVPVVVLAEPVAPAVDAAAQATPTPEAAGEAATAPLSAVSPRKRVRRLRRRVLAVIALGLLVSTLVLSWLLWQQRAHNPGLAAGNAAPPYRLLTATEQRESHPALSPDGTQVAYVAPRGEGGSAVVVQGVQPNSRPRLLRQPPDGAQDQVPVFSPDGGQVAFVRQHADGRCQVLLAAVAPADPAAGSRELLRCDGAMLPSFDFTADGSALVFGSGAQLGGPEGLARLSLDSLTWRVIDYPRQPGDLDHFPRVSPDGRWLVFVRNPQLGRVYRMPADGGPLAALDGELAEVRGLAWLADSRGVLAARWAGTEVRLQRLDALKPGRAQDLGLTAAQWPASARAAPVVAFMHRYARLGLTRLADGQPPQPLYRSSGRDLSPVLSPDGQQLALFSDRSGAPGLWLGSADGHSPLRSVPGVVPDIRQPVSWAPDGRRLLVLGQDPVHRRVLLEVDALSGAATPLRLPTGEPLQAVYATDADRVLLIERADDRGRLQLWQRQAGNWQAGPALEGVSQVRWDNGRVLLTRFDRPGLFAWDLQRPPQLLHARAPLRAEYRRWVTDGDGRSWLARRAGSCRFQLQALQPAEAGPVLPRCLAASLEVTAGGYSLGPEGRVVATEVLRDDSDIAIMQVTGTALSQL